MGDVIMTQHQTVMHLAENQGFAEARKFGNATDEEMAEGIIPEAHYLTTQNWEDMGSPEIITVTVVPGDILNNPPTRGEDYGKR